VVIWRYDTYGRNRVMRKVSVGLIVFIFALLILSSRTVLAHDYYGYHEYHDYQYNHHHYYDDHQGFAHHLFDYLLRPRTHPSLECVPGHWQWRYDQYGCLVRYWLEGYCYDLD